jgi:hypothetical protein
MQTARTYVNIGCVTERLSVRNQALELDLEHVVEVIVDH